MEYQPESSKPGHHLVWIIAGYLGVKLSAASRLETTRYLRRMGWKVTLINACPAIERQIRGVDVLCFTTIERYFLRQLVFHWKVVCFILRQKPAVDIIMFHQESGLWIFPLKLLRGLTGQSRPLFVLDNRSVYMPDAGTQTVKGWLRGLYIAVMNWVANNWADGQTAITVRIADTIHIPADKLWGVWSSGVNPEQFQPAISARRWPADHEPIELIYIGSMEYERNIMTFCQAVEEVNRLGMSFHFTLLGDGLQRAELVHFAQGTAGRIEVHPAVPHAEVVDYLARAHLGVLPFPDEEKFRVSSPVKLFEYMASGLVILATRIVCHTDVIGDCPCVYWVDRSSVEDFIATLKRIWKERSALQQMGREASEHARSFSWQVSADKLNAALEYGLNRTR